MGLKEIISRLKSELSEDCKNVCVDKYSYAPNMGVVIPKLSPSGYVTGAYTYAFLLNKDGQITEINKGLFCIEWLIKLKLNKTTIINDLDK